MRDLLSNFDSRQLEVEALEEFAEIRFIHQQLGAGGREIFNLVKCLKQTHFCDGILFGAGERAAGFFHPAFEGGAVHENFQREHFFSLGGDVINVLIARKLAAPRRLNILKLILIDVAARSRVALDAANCLRLGHGALFGPGAPVSIASRIGLAPVPVWNKPREKIASCEIQKRILKGWSFLQERLLILVMTCT